MKILRILFFVGFAFRLNAATDSVAKVYNLGINAYNRGEESDAKNLLEIVTQASDSYPVAYFVLGKIANNGSNPNKKLASEYFRKAFFSAGPKSGYKKNAAIMLSYTLADPKEATSFARQALGFAPADPDSKFALATALFREGKIEIDNHKYESSIPYLEESIYVRGDIKEARNSLASSYLQLLESNKSEPYDLCAFSRVQLDWLKMKVPTDDLYQENQRRFDEACMGKIGSEAQFKAHLEKLFGPTGKN
jgi:tetratricopeptide (TPR) repeat protein